jgi:hypothetical protein
MYKRIRTNKRLYELIGGTTISKMGGTTSLTLTFHTGTLHFTINKGTYSS